MCYRHAVIYVRARARVCEVHVSLHMYHVYKLASPLHHTRESTIRKSLHPKCGSCIYTMRSTVQLQKKKPKNK